MNKAGFTLVEIVVVIIIIGVLAGIGLPRLGKSLESGRLSEGVQILHTLRGAQKRYYLENYSYASALGNLDVELSSSLKYFHDVKVESNGEVSLKRKDKYGYTLKITPDGVISCSGDTICNQFHFE